MEVWEVLVSKNPLDGSLASSMAELSGVAFAFADTAVPPPDLIFPVVVETNEASI
jgi:hypothetical protein